MNKNRVFALVIIGIFILMSNLDRSIIITALPTISRELQIPLAQVTWVVTIYLIVISGIILFFGRLADLFGKSNIFKIGALIFTVGSFLAGLNFGLGLSWLLFARVVQAIGASMFMATSYGLIAEIFPPELRARAMSINAMFVSVGAISGPAIGGFILQFTSWNYIFWINVPVGIIGYLYSLRVLPKEKKQGSVRDIDFVGSVEMFACLILLFLYINFGQVFGWLNPLILLTIAGSVTFFVLFVYTELRKEKPLIDLKIFKTKLFSISIIMALLNYTVAMFSNVLMPFYLQNFRELSPSTAGMIMMAYPIAMLILSPISGALSDRFDKEWIAFIGISGVIISQIGYLMFNHQSSIWFVLLTLLVHGASAGLFQSPNNTLVMSTVDQRYLGIAGSINSLARNIAFVLGTNLATISLFLAMSTIAGRTISTYIESEPRLFLDGLRLAFFVPFVLVIIAWILGLARLLGRKKENHINTSH